MSNAPNASDPVNFDSAAEPTAAASFDAEVELVRAALARMQTTVVDERSTLGRLRGALGEMASLVAQAKTAMTPDAAEGAARKPFDTGALLDEFEHLIDAMIEIAGGAPAERAPAAFVEAPVTAEVPHAEAATAPPVETVEFSEVPTVSGVVSGLGSDIGASLDWEPDAETFPPAPAVGEAAPTVAMLKALVEALNASVPEAQAQPESVAQAGPETPVALEAQLEPEAPPAVVPVATTTRSAPAYREIIAAADPPRDDPDEAGTAISIAQTIQSFKWQPPEASHPPPVALATPEPQALVSEPQETADEPLPLAEAVDPTPADTTGLAAAPQDMAAVLSDIAALNEFDLLASFEQIGARPVPPMEMGTAVIFPRRIEPEPQAPAEPTLEELIAAELSASRSEPSETTPSTTNGDVDPETLLFGPEPEPDPAAFLLDPPPDTAALLETQEQSTPMAALPQPEFVAPETPQAEMPEVIEPAPAAAKPQDASPAPAQPADAPYDPLAPLKAMSDAEKIALFS